jgi:hypothetical protein
MQVRVNALSGSKGPCQTINTAQIDVATGMITNMRLMRRHARLMGEAARTSLAGSSKTKPAAVDSRIALNCSATKEAGAPVAARILAAATLTTPMSEARASGSHEIAIAV